MEVFNDMEVFNPKKLWAPAAYTQATPKEIARVIGRGGCGGGDGIGDCLVPDKMWGLSVHPACMIHDWMYDCGVTIEDKNEADRVFLNNVLRIIDAANSWWWLRRLRRRRAATYYHAVRLFGGPAFWSGKE